MQCLRNDFVESELRQKLLIKKGNISVTVKRVLLKQKKKFTDSQQLLIRTGKVHSSQIL